MNYIGKFLSNFKDAYNEINGATLTGAIDAVIVRQEDGSFVSSPFHVRFGKIGVLRSREKVVDIEINGEPVDIHMKLGETGEAFFVEEIEEGDDVGSFLGTSPLPNYLQYNPIEDDLRSQDSGVEAEEVICKSLKLKQSKENIRKISRSYTDICDNKTTTTTCQYLVHESDKSSYIDLVSDVRLENQTNSQEDDEVGRLSTFPSGSSPSVDVPKQKYWREELVRSKSLTSEPPFLQASNVVVDGQGSKTDIEEIVKVGKTLRRRKKKRTNSKKYRLKTNDSHSSDNSTTSEIVDLSSLSVTDAVPHQDSIFLMEDLENAQEECQNPSQQVDQGANTADRLPMSSKTRHWRNTVSIGPDFHPFSDTDLSPPPSPGTSRIGTPVKSDTEYEYEKQKNEMSKKTSAHNTETKWSWTWGELPTPPTNPRTAPNFSQGQDNSPKTQEAAELQSMTQAEDAQRSMLGNMFSFMRATKKARHNPESEGIYLDDLNLDELEPEVAALYFPRNSLLLNKAGYTGFRSVAKDDDDVESGNGTSLPQSPHSVEGAIGGAKMACIDSDFEESSTRHPIFDYKGYHDLAFSLCGNLHEHLDGDFPESLFLQSLVTYDDFCENPNVIDSPYLVVRFGSKYMNWATAASQIMALALFQRPLPNKVIENLCKENMPKKEIRKRTESKGYSWFSWGRNTDAQNSQNSQKSTFKSGESSVSLDAQSGENSQLPSTSIETFGSTPKAEGLSVSQPNLITESVSSSVTLKKDAHGETYVATVTTTTTCSRPEVVDSGGVQKPVQEANDSSESEHDDKTPSKRYKKTMRLSSDRIKKLNFRNGRNEVVFSVTTAYQGTTRCKCHVFLWNYDEKIVVSDIDGTITKSDVLGHILPIIGKDWAQGGVAQLFTKIKNNGYNFLYLSARAIGQARITREYLRSIKQGDVYLPDGPLLLNPTSLINAFHREVIEKKPEEFKISCLRDIKALFPINENPFYAGYGNKINDVWAYSAVGIPIQRIFTINHRGELKHELTQTFQTTYLGQVKLVDETFPPIEKKMLPRDLLSFMYSEDEEEDCEGIVDLDYDSEWEGFPTGIDAMNPSTP